MITEMGQQLEEDAESREKFVQSGRQAVGKDLV